ncbi:MAG: hypothetical protein JWQ81_5070 [Amycolatopsis sp.]|uniref:eCIS core domain-containing protein n=1 Tax=Amycolatopsis sp. TaxID=37632 RepID=UPI00262335B1|nr:DUF4157 domain-containing protein [Amycolatopsis sp.]MCU1684331.1 hypothetical protein [Amycolatopsis sp.]
MTRAGHTHPKNTPRNAPPIVGSVVRSPGEALDEETEAAMTLRFGHDFSQVRVHTDARAAESAEAVGARAYTVGPHVVFGAGQYAPGSAAGQRLLAHELTHVIQQGARPGGVAPGTDLKVSRRSDPAEREAHLGGPASAGTVGVMVQRDDLGHDTDDGPKDAGVPGGVSTPPTVSAAPAEPEPPQIRQGRIGELVGHLPDWNFLPTRGFVKPVLAKAAEARLLSALLIPELGVSVDVRGSAGADAALTGSYEGWLRNIQVGVSREQADEIALNNPFILLQGLPRTLDDVARVSTEFRGLADLDVSGRFGGRLHLGAALEAVASVPKLFDIAKIGAGLGADAEVEAELRFHDRVGIYGSGHQYHFRDAKSASLTLALHFNLAAFLEAGLLGATWRRDWNLARFDKNWTIGTKLDLHYDSGGPQVTDVTLTEQTLDVIGVVREMLTAATTQAHLTGAPGGPGAPAAPGGRPPTGRTSADPIPMTWYKPPGLYPASITLGGQQYFFIRPRWLTVPNTAKFADVRREATTDSRGTPRIEIGVSPSSKFYPKIGGEPWPRVEVKRVRGKVKQDQFRRLLRAHGYAWGTKEADHVRDLQWRGEDAYENLWPLEESDNLDANRILTQLVTYTDSTGAPRTARLGDTPLGLYFRIRNFA